MAHYAKLSENQEVLGVLCLDDVNEQNESGESVESIGQAYLEKHNNWPVNLWKKCSFNTSNGVHSSGDNSKAFRGNYPAKGMVFDETNQIFRSVRPFTSWTFNLSTHQWDPSIAPPQTTTNRNGKDMADRYDWDEINQTWNKVETDYPSA